MMDNVQTERRREAAAFCLRRFAEQEGFELGDVREVEAGDRVELRAAAPDGREFGVGYLKGLTNLQPEPPRP